MDLSTNYLGMKLRTPLVASASPLSRNVDDVKRLEEAGAAASSFTPSSRNNCSPAPKLQTSEWTPNFIQPHRTSKGERKHPGHW